MGLLFGEAEGTQVSCELGVGREVRDGGQIVKFCNLSRKLLWSLVLGTFRTYSASYCSNWNPLF